MKLSKSQLFSQLERLDMGHCAAEPWDGHGQLPPGLLALLTNSHFSNLKSLRLKGIIPYDLDWEELECDYPNTFKHFRHLKGRIDYDY